MGLVLKYVQRTKAGTFHYRRRVPTDLQEMAGKREFKRLLGETERVALFTYAKIHAECEKWIALLRRQSAPSATPSIRTPLDDFSDAASRIAALREVSSETGDADNYWRREALIESVLRRYPEDPETGEPLHVPEADRLFVNGLRNGSVARPEPTLEDAKRLYLKDRIEGQSDEVTKRARIERIMGFLHSAIERDRPLSRIERSDAREVRDHMLKDRGMTPSTARRYMNDIRAVVSHGLVELGVRGVDNPFRNLEIRDAAPGRDQRKPFKEAQVSLVETRLTGHAGTDLLRIWQMLAGTGCRLGEVAGLLVSDVVLDARVPHVDLVFHPHRRLKNQGSIRKVPLVGASLKAAKAAVAAAEGQFLFPQYARPRGPDAASRALMKHVRDVISDPKIVVHSLRHTMEDRMLAGGVSEFDRNLVLGHSRGGMSERYGGEQARLAAAARAIKAGLDYAASAKDK